jgi:prevent-host-death family protein
MRVVPATEFRRRLSYYLRLVKRGAELIITWRGTPVALVTPIARGVTEVERQPS